MILKKINYVSFILLVLLVTGFSSPVSASITNGNLENPCINQILSFYNHFCYMQNVSGTRSYCNANSLRNDGITPIGLTPHSGNGMMIAYTSYIGYEDADLTGNSVLYFYGAPVGGQSVNKPFNVEFWNISRMEQQGPSTDLATTGATNQWKLYTVVIPASARGPGTRVWISRSGPGVGNYLAVDDVSTDQALGLNFDSNVTSGLAPLSVLFTADITEFNNYTWDFGDGNNETGGNKVNHTYTNAGTYTISAINGAYAATKNNYINVTCPAPAANFSGNPTSGSAPLNVQFTDLSTGSPTSWNWSFGDSDTSTVQNPSHQYASAGTYTVSLNASNAGGNDTNTRSGFVTVTAQQTTFTVYADGVRFYYDPDNNTQLYPANIIPQEFYTNISGKVGDPYQSIQWAGLANPVDNETGSRNWNINEDANSMANNADFALHAGHGGNEGILFGTANPDYKLFRANNLSFGGNNGKAKWVALFSCSALEESNHEKWESVFNGLHILMGFDTIGILENNQGSQFAQRMTGSGLYPAPVKILDAWEYTLRDTIQSSSIRGAYMYADPSQDDFLPGFGAFRDPVKLPNDKYNITWKHFNCS